MKKLSRLLFFMFLLILNSCSPENDLETDPEVLNAISLQSPTVNQCTGYGLFVDTHGQQYDCGWKRGYEDWVYHYNSVASEPCSKIRVDLGVETDEINGTTYTTSVKTKTGKIDNSPFIIEEAIRLYQTYYNNLTANRNNSFFNMGQYDGYNAARGQMPYVDDPGNDVDCNKGGSPKPFDWPENWGDGDDDSDGIKNNQDQCPYTPSGEFVYANGCSPAQQDNIH